MLGPGQYEYNMGKRQKKVVFIKIAFKAHKPILERIHHSLAQYVRVKASQEQSGPVRTSQGQSESAQGQPRTSQDHSGTVRVSPGPVRASPGQSESVRASQGHSGLFKASQG